MVAGVSAKAPGALRTIGEVSAETGIATHILRYWESHVAALRPVRRAGGRRYFRPEDVALVRQLDQLIHHQGYTLDGAARTIAGGEPAASAAPVVVPSPSVADNSAYARSLSALRDRLRQALAAS
ncbi:MAG: MerR family transcriptional regulator [Sphingomonadaceae bacterium]|nr:MerR family transcriptional regulator [Sphingomonadaceae bacterium]